MAKLVVSGKYHLWPADRPEFYGFCPFCLINTFLVICALHCLCVYYCNLAV